MVRGEKELLVKELMPMFQGHSCMIVVQQKGINALEMTRLRKEVRAVGGIFKIVKNKLARLALHEESPTSFKDTLSGPTGIFLSKDPVAIAKIIENFSKKIEDKFFPVAALLDGAHITGKHIKYIASLPSFESLRAQLLSVLQAPSIGLLRVMKEPSASLARLFSAYQDKL